MIYVISDTHLRHNTPFEYQIDLCKFLMSITDEDKLFIAGDFLDFWTSANSEVIVHNEIVFKNLPKHTYIINGNHDYILHASGFQIYGDYGFTVSEKRFKVLHGFELDVIVNYEHLSIEGYTDIAEYLCSNGNTIGTIATLLWNYYSYAFDVLDILKDRILRMPETLTSDILGINMFAESAGRNLLLDLSPDAYLIFGHTHSPYIGKISANSGKFPDYLTIDDTGKVDLHIWK